MILYIKEKALSVNKCWQGKRYKSKDYKQYEKKMLSLLPDIKFNANERITLKITFGYSNKLTDIDNGLKPLIDILQKQYKFNDRYIYDLTVKKEIVKKGDEFIQIQIK